MYVLIILEEQSKKGQLNPLEVLGFKLLEVLNNAWTITSHYSSNKRCAYLVTNYTDGTSKTIFLGYA